MPAAVAVAEKVFRSNEKFLSFLKNKKPKLQFRRTILSPLQFFEEGFCFHAVYMFIP